MPEVISRIHLDAKLLRRIDSLKELNHHGEAYLAAAQALGLTALVEAFTRINRDHERAGYLTPDLSFERRAAYEALLAQARTLLTEEQYNKLYGCF